MIIELPNGGTIETGRPITEQNENAQKHVMKIIETGRKEVIEKDTIVRRQHRVDRPVKTKITMEGSPVEVIMTRVYKHRPDSDAKDMFAVLKHEIEIQERATGQNPNQSTNNPNA